MITKLLIDFMVETVGFVASENQQMMYTTE